MNCTYNEFESYCKTKGWITVFTDKFAYELAEQLNVEEDELPALVSVEWEIGGASGGSCWGSGASSYTLDNIEPATWNIHSILRDLWPEISLFEFLDFMEQYSHFADIRETGYYGNYEEYKIHFVSLTDVFQHLLKLGN